jgi:predicted O-methyltransferase YrrM
MESRISRLLTTTGARQPRILAHETIDAVRIARSNGHLQAMTPAEAFAAAGELFPGGPSQDPDEFLPFLEHCSSSDPRVVVEIGTESGGTHFTFGHALRTVELTIAVDLTLRNRARLARYHRPDLQVRQIQGSSRDGWVLDKVRKILNGRPIDVLFIDGDHSYYGATEDYRRYAPLVREGGVIAFHDIVPDQRLRTGVDRFASGEVPLLWQQINPRMESREFVASWEQDGRGIGAVVADGDPWPFGLTGTARPEPSLARSL